MRVNGQTITRECEISLDPGFFFFAISEFPSASVSKRVQVQNLSYENELDLHLNGLVSKTDFHMKGFALGLVLKQRQRELGNGLL